MFINLKSSSVFLTAVLFFFAASAYGSRLAYEHVGQITEIATASGNIKIDGTSYRLGNKVAIHSRGNSTGSTNVNSLHSGMSIGYTTVSNGAGKKPEITSIWVLSVK